MFNYEKKTLNPLARELIKKFEKAASIENPKDRVTELMSLEIEADHKYDLLAEEDAVKRTCGLGIAAVAAIAGYTPVALALSPYVLKKFFNAFRLYSDRDAIVREINYKISEALGNDLFNADASPGLANALRGRFDGPGGKKYEELVKRIS